MERKIKSLPKKALIGKKYVITALLVSGIAMAVSGLILQFHYHLLKNTDESMVWALSRLEWNTLHVWVSAVFLVVALYHVRTYRKWYDSVFKRRLFSKHRSTLILTFLALLVVVTGLVPLLIGNPLLGSTLIEIHDKAALIFLVVLFRHTAKRLKRLYS